MRTVRETSVGMRPMNAMCGLFVSDATRIPDEVTGAALLGKETGTLRTVIVPEAHGGSRSSAPEFGHQFTHQSGPQQLIAEHEALRARGLELEPRIERRVDRRGRARGLWAQTFEGQEKRPVKKYGEWDARRKRIEEKAGDGGTYRARRLAPAGAVHGSGQALGRT
ncbi:hypothetical protein C8J57DRAFT_1460430 [Mycena rebaudengoi]|nr:hypothetical protein C8J57DRAFT_1460430 [Mycena rebaudengoi]